LSYVCVAGSPTRTRTWIDRLTVGRPTVGRSGNSGGAPRTRTELNLLAKEIRGPCACPDLILAYPSGPDPPAPRDRSNGEKESLTPRMRCDGAWGRFRAHLSAASTRRFHQISFPGNCSWCGRRESNPCLCVVTQHAFGMTATHGSAIELRTLVHRAGLEPAKPEGSWFTARPRCQLSICA
jgi:hypothetical protein